MPCISLFSPALYVIATQLLHHHLLPHLHIISTKTVLLGVLEAADLTSYTQFCRLEDGGGEHLLQEGILG